MKPQKSSIQGKSVTIYTGKTTIKGTPAETIIMHRTITENGVIIADFYLWFITEQARGREAYDSGRGETLREAIEASIVSLGNQKGCFPFTREQLDYLIAGVEAEIRG